MVNRMKNIATILIAILCILQLTGCQLAVTNEGMNDDELCGVFVTVGNHDMMYQDKTLDEGELKNINISRNKDGTYSLNQDNIFNSHTTYEGTKMDNDLIEFKDLKGYYLGLNHITLDNGETSKGTTSDPKFSKNHYKVSMLDNGSENTIEGTLYVKNNFNNSLFINPVYQRKDGSFYTILGSSMGVMIRERDSGDSYSQTISYSKNSTVDGKSKTNKISFITNFNVVDVVDHIIIKEMNQNDQLIKETTYLPNDPTEFAIQSNTTYIIVEDHVIDDSQYSMIKRHIYDVDNNSDNNMSISHPCYFNEDDGIIGGRSIIFIR